MDLYSWIEQSGFPMASWARRWKIEYATLSNIARRRSRASYDIGKKIVAETLALAGGRPELVVSLDEVCGKLPEQTPAYPDRRFRRDGSVAAAVVAAVPPTSAAARRAKRAEPAAAPKPKAAVAPAPAAPATPATPKPKRAPKTVAPAPAAPVEPARRRGRRSVDIPDDYRPPVPAVAAATTTRGRKAVA